MPDTPPRKNKRFYTWIFIKRFGYLFLALAFSCLLIAATSDSMGTEKWQQYLCIISIVLACLLFVAICVSLALYVYRVKQVNLKKANERASAALTKTPDPESPPKDDPNPFSDDPDNPQ